MKKKTDAKTKRQSFISLQKYCIENHMEYLLNEWDYKKNGCLVPENVTAGSEKKVWWCLPYNDKKTGKHFNFEWKSQINNRANGAGCPFLSGHKVWKGFNDLATIHPELTAEWDYEKNKLLPSEVTAGSRKSVGWKCKDCGYRWKTAVVDRNKTGCPKCAKEMKTSFPEQAVSFYLEKHFPDAENGNRTVLGGKELDIYIPSIPAAVEYDGRRFHKNVKCDLEKNRLCAGRGILLVRIREDGCPAMEDAPFLKVISCAPGKEESLADAIRQAGEILGVGDMDVDIERDRQEIYSRYIKLRKENSLAVTHPELAVQWDYEKNGNLTPENVTAGSNGKVWWLLPYDDRKTGRHFDFSWQASIANRARGTGCPFLTGKKVWKGFNDLETYCRENGRLDILSQWDYEKNGDLKPSDVTVRSGKRVWRVKNGKSELRYISNFIHK